MRTIVSYLVIAAVLFGAVGCGGTRKSETPTGSTSTQSDHGTAQTSTKGSRPREGS